MSRTFSRLGRSLRTVWFSTPAPGESPAEEDWEIVVKEGARALYYDWASGKWAQWVAPAGGE